MKIILSGGGTLGSVSPLIAVWQVMKNQNISSEFLWVGTSNGPEKAFVSEYKIPYRSIVSAKLRKYFSLKNIFTPSLVFIAFIQSFFLILKYKPKVIVSAGSFVSVPLVWAGWCLGVKSLIHQQDI